MEVIYCSSPYSINDNIYSLVVLVDSYTMYPILNDYYYTFRSSIVQGTILHKLYEFAVAGVVRNNYDETYHCVMETYLRYNTRRSVTFDADNTTELELVGITSVDATINEVYTGINAKLSSNNYIHIIFIWSVSNDTYSEKSINTRAKQLTSDTLRYLYILTENSTIVKIDAVNFTAVWTKNISTNVRKIRIARQTSNNLLLLCDSNVIILLDGQGNTLLTKRYIFTDSDTIIDGIVTNDDHFVLLTNGGKLLVCSKNSGNIVYTKLLTKEIEYNGVTYNLIFHSLVDCKKQFLYINAVYDFEIESSTG